VKIDTLVINLNQASNCTGVLIRPVLINNRMYGCSWQPSTFYLAE